MNSFWCPWHPLYGQQKDIQHYLLIERIVEEQKHVYCTDPTFQRTDTFVTLDDLVRDLGMLEVVVFTRLEYREEIDWKTFVQNTMNLLTGPTRTINQFEAIRHFAQEIQGLESLKAELEGYSISATAPLLFGLNEIARHRHKYALFLECLGDRSGIDRLLSFSDEMQQVSTVWGNVRNLLLKAAVIDKKSLFQRTANKIAAIAEMEESIADKLRVLVQGA